MRKENNIENRRTGARIRYFSILFSSGLYRRSGILTLSGAYALRRLCRPLRLTAGMELHHSPKNFYYFTRQPGKGLSGISRLISEEYREISP